VCGQYDSNAAPLTYRREEQLLAGADWGTVYREQVLPAKLTIDLDYLARRTLISDLKLVLQTVVAVFD
jgi:lipopolysaccharide/colanic/teichoic acid biosynthesis glycosyltransferase